MRSSSPLSSSEADPLPKQTLRAAATGSIHAVCATSTITMGSAPSMRSSRPGAAASPLPMRTAAPTMSGSRIPPPAASAPGLLRMWKGFPGLMWARAPKASRCSSLRQSVSREFSG
ncbi:hypothetical protein C0214_06010 [Methylobacterium sp. DM1]|nr:hypothetical protein C0214_06010 [Methylobacterium sp. DM1]